VKFIADVMLGKLAKWLRILGYDTLYDSDYSDDDLFFTAHQQKRILLTRDGDLAQRMNPDYCFFIDHASVREQVKQVVSHFRLNTKDRLFTRCTLCNSLVIPISKSRVKNRVPEFVYRTIDEFYYCQSCDKIYWAGSHIKQVRELLSQLSLESKNE